MEAEQEKEKMRAAQEILHQAKKSVDTGTVGSTEQISETLLRVGEILDTQASAAPDRKSEKAVSDIARLAEAAQNVVQEKDIGDRLQRIAKEGELATMEQERIVKNTSVSLGSKKTAEAKTHAQIIANNFAPIFELVVYSFEFRRLVLDFIKISRAVFLRSVKDDDVGTRVERQWLRGRDPAEIAKDISSTTIESMKTEEGKIELLITEEELDILVYDMMELFSLIARDPKYHEGLSRLFDLTELLYEETRELSETITEKAKEAARQPHTQKLAEETKELIAEFTGRDYLEIFLDRLRNLARRLRQDPETQAYLQDLKKFVLETRDPSLIQSDEFKDQTRVLVERGRTLVDNLRYRPEVEEFLDSADRLVENLKNDELVAELRERSGIVFEDLTYEDSAGNRQLDTQVLGNIRTALVPALADALKYIPIP
jgi:hypothetical protein